MQPSGTAQAKEKFMAGVEKTRQAAAPKDALGSTAGTTDASNLRNQNKMPGDNPKAGGHHTSTLAKGDTNASTWNPQPYYDH
ncbi:hypothetical protein DL765_008211 [Monosporascus sp. GIB2]|nr:hypothetical protein DL765_008211 [Monosporascus sp. GIB2]